MSLLKEFKTFAMRGNVIDMAVGIIIGAAFGKIVASLVADIIMPPIGLLVGGIDFTAILITLKHPVLDPVTGEVIKAGVVMKIGTFIQTLVDFIIIAFAIFLMIKGINKLDRKKEEPAVPSTPPPPTRDQELLTEIRDLLKKL
ncbi:MAG: large-conductance mechanosensitive channel protein MscL [Bacteroidales bacterium]|nr:large-conductance mechanosensitive channel protein MscL [Bacteroidales bacterium]